MVLLFCDSAGRGVGTVRKVSVRCDGVGRRRNVWEMVLEMKEYLRNGTAFRTGNFCLVLLG